jgi:DUF1680 family protein
VKLHFELAEPVKSKIRIRIPSWAISKMDISVNGKKAATGKPGSYITLNRTWKHNDVISFTIPTGFRLTKYAGLTEGFQGKETYALEYGPVLMGLSGNVVQNGILNFPFTADELTEKLKPVAGKPLHFSIEGDNNSLEYVPYYEINTELFTCYPFFAEKAVK